MPRRSMRSPRRIDFAHKALEKITFSKSPPPTDSISWKLWLACQDLAQQALSTDYVHGIANGNLDPNDYGQYNIQDCAYCNHAQEDYQTVETRASKAGYSTLAAFAQARYDSYVKYTNQLLQTWHISDANAVSPGQAGQDYINFEHTVANTFHPIYGVVAMIPCDQLWPWLATELQPDSSSNNIYNFWIKDNADWGGAYRLDNFIDAWFAAHPQEYSWETAFFVYQSCMIGELNFFKSACGQPLSPMPIKGT